jgi:predicted RNA binding protein YcfA (HicA-like mRNA interferase family)
MKMPRDINANSLIKVLKPLGYEVSRQVGSHIRLTTFQNGVHHITIPNNNPIKIGTLSSILYEVANHFKTTKDDIVRMIFK